MFFTDFLPEALNSASRLLVSSARLVEVRRRFGENVNLEILRRFEAAGIALPLRSRIHGRRPPQPVVPATGERQLPTRYTVNMNAWFLGITNISDEA